MKRHSALALSLALFVLVPSYAGADLPPPNDKKFIPYGFRVDNVKAFPDYVVLAFPWSLSGGAPTKEHALVEDGKQIAVGRRSSTPELYAMKKTEYETWKASYEPTHEYQDPALDKLFSSKSVVRCNAKLSPEFLVDKSDPRNEIVEAFRVEAIDATTCRIAVVAAKAATPATASTPVSTPTSSANAPGPASPAPPATPPGKAGGCGGCVTAATEDRSFSFSALVLVSVLAWLGRRAPRRRCGD